LAQPLPISVHERGEKSISSEQWEALAADPAFWQLVEGNIVSVSHPTTDTVVLRGSCYVGRAETAAGTLEIVEKVNGALASLLTYATYEAFRVDPLAAPATDLGELAVLLVRQFHAAVYGYVSRGRDRRFVQSPYAGSLVGGRINLTRTLQLRARGLGHLIAFDRNELTRSTDKNRVILAALREVEQLTDLIPLTDDDLARGRSLAQFFHDCRDAEVLFGKRSTLAAKAARLADQPLEGDSDLLALAAVVLSHVSFENTAIVGAIAPRAWFLNLETLFEHAVRRCFHDVCYGSQVIKGSAIGAGVFPTSPGLAPADPDIVIYAMQTTHVGDVKYKDWERAAGARADLYQLLVHAAAFDGGSSFLVYPHDKFEAVELGDAVTGSTCSLFAIDVRDVASSVRRCVARLGIPVDKGFEDVAA
jgi:5-methylcytosine-specific restriction endonuclease McrBC regulatory subunit McrC